MDYNAINAKIKGQRRDLLTGAEYRLIATSPNVQSVIRYLQQTNGYKKILFGLPELRRSYVEERLSLSILYDYRKLYQFIPDFEVRRFLKAYYLKFEHKVLKQMIRLIFDQDEIKEPCTSVRVLSETHNVDVNQIFAAQTLTDLVHCFERTELDYLSVLTSNAEDSLTIECQLDIRFYMNVWKKIKKCFTGVDRQILMDIIGTEIDLQNLMLIYRFKNSYDIDDELIFSFLVPINYHVHRDYVIKLVKTQTVEEFRNVIDQGPYKKFFDSMNSERNSIVHGKGNYSQNSDKNSKEDITKNTYTFSLETCYYNTILDKYLKWYREKPNSMATIMLYLFEKEWEMSNITQMIEGARYEIPAESILSSLHHRKTI